MGNFGSRSDLEVPPRYTLPQLIGVLQTKTDQFKITLQNLQSEKQVNWDLFQYLCSELMDTEAWLNTLNTELVSFG